MIRLPDNPECKVVNVLVGGFCAGEATHEPLRAELERVSGNKTIYAGSLRQGDCESPKRSAIRYPGPLDLQARYLGSQLKDALFDMWFPRLMKKELPPDGRLPFSVEFRIFGHSLGAAVSMLTAVEYMPKNARVSLRSLAPACYRREGLRLVGRTFRKGLNDRRLIRENQFPEICEIMALGGPGMREYMSNLPRTIAEGIMLMRTDIYTRLQEALADRKISVLTAYAEHDELFPDLPHLPRNLDNAIILEGVTHDVQYFHKTVVAQLADNGYL